MDYLYFVKPLKSKAGKHVKMAIQELVLQLRHENLPVVRIHSDRAHEMRSAALREWTLNNNILLTRTEGQSPQANGTAERAIRFMKGKARMLLRSSGLDTKHWATAMITAAYNQREERLRPETHKPVCPYGSPVAIKKKRYGQGGKYDLLPRWTKGVYLGPVWDVGGGSAVLEDETKRITVTTHIRPRLHDPGVVAEEPVIEFEPPVRRRLRRKVPVDDDGLEIKAARMKILNEGEAGLREEIVKEAAGFGVKRPQIRAEGEPAPEEGYMTFGAFQHGGVVGITRATRDNPELAAKIAALVAEKFPEEVFSSVTIVNNVVMPIHKDVYNDKTTKNLVVPLQVTNDAGLWEQLLPGDEYKGNYKEMEFKGRMVPGQVYSLQKEQKINPSRLHGAVQPTRGPRLLLAGYTIGSWKKLKEPEKEILNNLGFQVPDEEDEYYLKVRALTEDQRGASRLPYMIDEEEAFNDFHEKDSAIEVEEDIARCAKAAAENLYTYDIERVLSELKGEELRMVHTVHQSEVDANIKEWIPSMAEEVQALEGMNAIRRRRGQDAKDYLAQPGVVVVPGKGVFTVKPPSKEGSAYRRKSRIVSCGNFQPKGEAESNYSGGAASEAVRLGIAESARRKWWVFTGDVCNAFLRAPVPEGTKLALRPPAVLVRAGLAEPGEVWEVLTAMYGFRTSPRWWSTYRTRTMQAGKATSGYTFKQGVADPDTWQVKDEKGATIALIIVYVDDYLVTGPLEVCQEVNHWFSTTWKTNTPQCADKENTIRFLGMEIKMAADPDGNFDGYTLDQEGYIQELLRTREVKDHSIIPAQKEWMSLDPNTFPKEYTPEQLKEAQSRTGELSWLSQRTRPDICYTVNIMSALVTKDPEKANLIGKKCLSYINHTKDWRLHYRPGGGRELTTYTDSSYAPEGGRSHGGAVTFWSSCPIAWKSSRQALVTTSSAETELVEAHLGAQQMESVDALLQDIGEYAERRVLCVDNAAAITLATSEGGSWKTRHLKVRHGALRQKVEDKWLSIQYCPGDQQLADTLTKILASQRLTMLMEFWGLFRQQGERGDRAHLRQVQAPAEQQHHKASAEQQNNQHTATIASSTGVGNLGCCLGLLVALQSIIGVKGKVNNPEAHAPLAVDSSLELYGIILMLVICTVALWEAGRGCLRGQGEAARLRSLQETRMSKREMKQLNALLQRDPAELRPDERETLMNLADVAGVDLSHILKRSPTRSSSSSAEVEPRATEERDPAPPVFIPPPPSASAADEEFLRMRRMQRAGLPRPPPEPPTHTYEDLVEEDERRRRSLGEPVLAFEPREPSRPRTREVATQVELLKEMPKEVYTTPSGGCVHATRDCSTLSKSTKFVKKDVCQRCISGQRETTERPLA